MERKKYWLVGQFQLDENNQWKDLWEFSGLFDSEEKAVNACRDEGYFVYPVELNKQSPHETTEMKEAYYPLGVSHGT